MIMPVGLDYKHILDDGYDYDGHFTYCATLTGTREKKSESRVALAPSIDQMMADHIAKTTPLKAPLLTLGVQSVGDGCSTSWKSARVENKMELDPQRLFGRVFSGAAMPPAQIDQTRQRQKSILDFVNKELAAFGRRLGADDQFKLEAHQQSVRELELRLNNAGSIGASAANCMGPAIGAGGTDIKAKAMFDITAVALKCDVTRVVTITMYDDGGGDGNSFPFLGVNKDYHAVAHGGSGQAAAKIKIDSWIYSNVANLAKQLDETRRGRRDRARQQRDRHLQRHGRRRQPLQRPHPHHPDRQLRRLPEDQPGGQVLEGGPQQAAGHAVQRHGPERRRHRRAPYAGTLPELVA